MKYIVVLADGAADYPIAELGNKTPLQAAKTPVLDSLARYGEMGMVRTVPQGMNPGSDTANLSVMGYDPKVYYTGRSPFEAISMGIDLKSDDVTFRCNLVTLSDDEPYEDKIILDHSSDEISSEEARHLIEKVQAELGTGEMCFYPGVSYRHILAWHHAPEGFDFTPPHDILEKKISPYLPKGAYGDVFLAMMKKSNVFLRNHPVNRARADRGLKMGNSIWFWGEGKRPSISSFADKYHLKGTVISAVDLIKGIGICAGLKSVDVPGVTGNVHTNFTGKAQAALDELKNGQDFVYIHLEAPDESGHRYEIENKVKSIELIDQNILRPIMDELEKRGEEYRLMVLPDHPTPLALRTHTDEPVPFLIYCNTCKQANSGLRYDESTAKQSGLFFMEGHRLMDHFIQG